MELNRPVEKVLIANRGAIACRVIRTLRTLGITSVVVYAEADTDSLHVRQADEAWPLGEGTPAQTYLDQDKLFEVVRQSGAGAIHPGYGFLSENADFARRCEAEGVVFLGPTPEQMEQFGLKHTARALAKEAGVPLLPGTELLTDLDDALAAASHIGYPVMLKSTAGGGGIGMSRCYSAEDLEKSFESVQRLSQNNFSNSGVFLEKFVEHARHIEVQLFGDGQGQVLALGERDCSAQRRNQKVIEEAPAPGLTDDVRARMHATARQLGESIAYRSAGTVEFIYDPDNGEFYFLEVNTRLQVEHGVTEEVYNVDLVRWMVELGMGTLADLAELSRHLNPAGHAIQARIYAEDPNKDFQPGAGLLTNVDWPEDDGLRIDTWIQPGTEVSPLFDPMLAKVIVHEAERESARTHLLSALGDSRLYGIETNLAYVQQVLADPRFVEGRLFTRTLNEFDYRPATVDVLTGGTLTTIQDYPGRIGYWEIGVPPSGPFDSYSFRLGNRLLGNPEGAPGLEITLKGPVLQFNRATQIVLTGAQLDATLDDQPVKFWQVVNVPAGATLKLGATTADGARAYVLFRGGLDCPEYLTSCSTFTLGQFGGHCGRALRAGDVLALAEAEPESASTETLPNDLKPAIGKTWDLHVTYGPHGAPDYFTEQDIRTFFDSEWEIHYNSSRTGVRLIGPKPEWARSDGGEAGMHPSNIHDNAYAVGTVDFTGDMPVILGPDGPSLGGFVCPVTVVSADLWKLGQLKAGDKVRFVPVSQEQAVVLRQALDESIATLTGASARITPVQPVTPVLDALNTEEHETGVVYRAAGDNYVLVEYGDMELDIRLRFRAHALMLWLREQAHPAILELTPGIRSLQVHYDSQQLDQRDLLDLLIRAEKELEQQPEWDVPARIVHLPLSWDDEACQQAINKYMQSVRKDAPWCPSNLEFIRRINGLESIDEVKKTVFDASYLVMGLGDVYLGAPVATPLDPRHRLVTTKYNPARTWTAENSVGIGGAYLCIYGMEGPGGYQFVGRTLQMWNRYRTTEYFQPGQPWLLRFFDQIRFYEVSAKELQQIRRDFPNGDYPIQVEETRFNLKDYEQFLADNQSDIEDFTHHRKQAFDEELQRWIESGQINFSAESPIEDTGEDDPANLPAGQHAVESHVAGSVWECLVKPGDMIEAQRPVAVVESMKMEIELLSPVAGKVIEVRREAGQAVAPGAPVVIVEELTS
ncbi:urea carboxylase [Marinobacter persicus]|uniref:Biotin carboxylase n=1 Tax=Marinobacter persicus TaxID=930118 RepID=A0A2S6G2T3_9GAMM|nr:urea carboxylase [Marinobacter persicus]PPK51162.1 urea carboxylase [Marinobacter persicus]PPK52422.1 urea carboxylase [Marinobacter persicus]PPK57761.1 urea carboxylase [Marinobacter persicus]